MFSILFIIFSSSFSSFFYFLLLFFFLFLFNLFQSFPSFKYVSFLKCRVSDTLDSSLESSLSSETMFYSLNFLHYYFLLLRHLYLIRYFSYVSWMFDGYSGYLIKFLRFLTYSSLFLEPYLNFCRYSLFMYVPFIVSCSYCSWIVLVSSLCSYLHSSYGQVIW